MAIRPIKNKQFLYQELKVSVFITGKDSINQTPPPEVTEFLNDEIFITQIPLMSILEIFLATVVYVTIRLPFKLMQLTNV